MNNNIQHNDIQHNNIQHSIKKMSHSVLCAESMLNVLSITLSVIMLNVLVLLQQGPISKTVIYEDW